MTDPPAGNAASLRRFLAAVRDDAAILCLDFEASSIGPHSYPIEVALCDPVSLVVHSWLIRPVPEWLALGVWDPASAAIHGIALDWLVASGQPVEMVAESLAEAAKGARVLSDSPRHDGHWLRRLYAATGAGSPPFALDDFHRFAWAAAAHRSPRPDGALVRAEAEAQARCPATHRAGPDARHNAEILRRLAPDAG
jgi:hypothetical protein